MHTELREDLETGIEEIDNQHRDLLRKIDDLLQASKELRGQEEIARLLWFLKRYVRKHFRDEEKLQRERGYPGYPQHKMQHDWFYREVQRLEGRYAAEGASIMMVVQSIRMMSDWLKNHFMKMDKALAAYLRRDTASSGPL
ncbi:bacteriohemerythrin [Geomesophilobacter sediminis]|uniref:Hemerythrin family protein n=1 Tax=Geomesophilobacter sediminis TaxID=2798584 RepID=A0A8J7M0J4_9BACT|nr:bacteriohemerythrin [Geomesophilobacter sediminis]MBJ6725502.1 hemerythrin family protein [Geomesophilobacter sediminis]